MADVREVERQRLEERLRILDAVLTGLDAPHELLEVVLVSADASAARSAIQERWGLDEVQAAAVLDAQLRRFTVQDVERVRRERAERLEELAQLDRESD